jgi:ADP-ribosylglycohydrolase
MLYKRIFLIISLSTSFICYTLTPEQLIDRIKASMIGGACGDALGRIPELINLSKSKALNSVDDILKEYPNFIRTFGDLKPYNDVFPYCTKDGKKVFLYTDDTAMAILVFNVLTNARKFNFDLNMTMQELARAFVRDMKKSSGWACESRAPGNTCLKRVRELDYRLKVIEGNKKFEELEQTLESAKSENRDHKSTHVDLQNSALHYSTDFTEENFWKVGQLGDGGCGSVMRAHPCGLIFADDIKMAEEVAVTQSLLTHGDPMAQAACAAMAVGIVHALHHKKRFEIAQEMMQAAAHYDMRTADMINQAIEYARKNYHADTIEELFELSKPVFARFRGWAAHEAIAAATYIFLVCSEDIQDAIFLGIHTPGDCDSIASMAAALVGAYGGMKHVPKDWITQVEDGTYISRLSVQMAQHLIKMNAPSLWTLPAKQPHIYDVPKPMLILGKSQLQVDQHNIKSSVNSQLSETGALINTNKGMNKKDSDNKSKSLLSKSYNWLLQKTTNNRLYKHFSHSWLDKQFTQIGYSNIGLGAVLSVGAFLLGRSRFK